MKPYIKYDKCTRFIQQLDIDNEFFIVNNIAIYVLNMYEDNYNMIQLSLCDGMNYYNLSVYKNTLIDIPIYTYHRGNTVIKDGSTYQEFSVTPDDHITKIEGTCIISKLTNTLYRVLECYYSGDKRCYYIRISSDSLPSTVLLSEYRSLREFLSSCGFKKKVYIPRLEFLTKIRRKLMEIKNLVSENSIVVTNNQFIDIVKKVGSVTYYSMYRDESIYESSITNLVNLRNSKSALMNLSTISCKFNSGNLVEVYVNGHKVGTYDLTNGTKQRSIIVQINEDVNKKIKHLESLREAATAEIMNVEVIDDDIIIDNSETLGFDTRYHNILSVENAEASDVNANTLLGDLEEFSILFLNASKGIEEHLQSLSTGDGFLNKLKRTMGVGKVVHKMQDTKKELSSVQQNIDELFGSVNKRYNNLVDITSKLQSARKTMQAQQVEMEKLQISMKEDIDKYGEENQADIPVRLLTLYNKVSGSVGKYKNRIAKYTSAILAAQQTVVTLGNELPSLRVDISDEMALTSLLSGIDNYQGMIDNVTELVSNITEQTSDKTYNVLENLMDMHIKNDSGIKLIQSGTEKTARTVKMMLDKSKVLENKTKQERTILEQISNDQMLISNTTKLNALEKY